MSRRGARDRLRRASPLLFVALLLSCGPTSRDTQPRPAPSLEVEYAGCKAVLVPGPVCVLDSNRKLRLWVGAPPDADIEIQIDGSRIEATAENIRNGQMFSLILPPRPKRVELLVGGQRAWSLPLAQPEDGAGAVHDVLRDTGEKANLVLAGIQDRRLAEVRQTLNRLRLPAGAPAESRCLEAFSRSLLAEREGDYRSALDHFETAVEIAERVKLTRYHWLASQELGLLLHKMGRFREAARLFERLRQNPQSKDPCDFADLLSNEAWSALLARDAGEAIEDPTPLLEQALENYSACKRVKPEYLANVFLNLATAHLQEGRLAETQHFLNRAHEIEPDPPLSHTLWWMDLEARMALLGGRPAAARALFGHLEELALAASSPENSLRAVFGQAQSQDALANPTAALETLRKAEALLDEQSLQIPMHQGRETFLATRQGIVSLHLRILLDQDRNVEALGVARHSRSRVLRQLEHGDRLAALPPERRTRWVDLLTEYQERRAALEERAKDDWRLPPDQLRHEQAARAAESQGLKVLLDEAFLVLGSSGEPSGEGEEPRAPRPGELSLTYHPLAKGWVGFASDGKTVKARRFDLPPDLLSRPEELSQRLLLPFQASIRQARRLRILSSGPLESVDFHALPFDGDILLAGRPVAYGLDLPISTVSARAPGRHALLVADPRGDLPGTLDEARAVRQILESGSWVTQELKSTAATAEAVRGRLATADLLHYAGHGTYSGFGGWESDLLLADDTRLTLGDFLALDRVPAWVVLSGCDTGRSSADTPVESLGLAHAFLLAGSRSVVASTRLADDRKVPGFLAELYRQWNRDPDLAVALQRAQLSWRKRHSGMDWAGFRLFEP
jgi:tetratricopeptide (TPR) repeat protein